MQNKKERCVGRPAGRRKTSKIEVLLEPEIKQHFMDILHREGKSASVVVSGWIRDYIKKEGKEC